MNQKLMMSALSGVFANAAEAQKSTATGPTIPSSFPDASGGGKSEPKPTSMEFRGEEDGKKIAEAAKLGHTTMRNILFSAAKELNGDVDRIEQYLTGYGKGLLVEYNPGTAKVMKSQAKAVMMAYAKTGYTRTIGMNEDKSPKQATQDGNVWLSEFKGTFQKWLELARDINGNNASTGTSTRKGPTKVTDKGLPKIAAQVKVMTADQAAGIAEEALKQVSADAAGTIAEQAVAKVINLDAKGWEGRIALQLEGLADQLAGSTDGVWAEIGKQVSGIVGAELARQSEIMKKAAEAMKQSEALKQEAAQGGNVATGTTGS